MLLLQSPPLRLSSTQTSRRKLNSRRKHLVSTRLDPHLYPSHDLCAFAAFHNPHNIKRPQAKKAGPTVKKATMPAVIPVSAGETPVPSTAQQHGIDWYRSTADDDAAIIEERRQRNWEDKQKKKEQRKFNKMFGQWNPQAPHKPERYSNLRAYRASGGYRRKKEGFNAFLRGAADQARSHEESEGANEPQPTSSSEPDPFSSAAKPSFAPPASYDEPTTQSGEDTHARPMHLSEQSQNEVPPPATASPSNIPRAFPPPPSVGDDYPPSFPHPKSAPPLASIYQGSTISAPPVRYSNATISAPPVRFERPDVQMDDADNEPVYDERPAKRPKISKAEAMMAKMGYKKGQGLGKNSDGVVTHLEVKKRKVPPGASTFDEEGGKVKSQQVWDVRGGERTQKDEPGRFGEESSVVVTWGCVEGINWDTNADRNDGGIRQDMGEAFSSKVIPAPNSYTLSRARADSTGYSLGRWSTFNSTRRTRTALSTSISNLCSVPSTLSIDLTRAGSLEAERSKHGTMMNASSTLAYTIIEYRMGEWVVNICSAYLYVGRLRSALEDGSG